MHAYIHLHKWIGVWMSTEGWTKSNKRWELNTPFHMPLVCWQTAMKRQKENLLPPKSKFAGIFPQFHVLLQIYFCPETVTCKRPESARSLNHEDAQRFLNLTSAWHYREKATHTPHGPEHPKINFECPDVLFTGFRRIRHNRRTVFIINIIWVDGE